MDEPAQRRRVRLQPRMQEAMKKLLLLLLLLPACVGSISPSDVTRRDWSTFQFPSAGTPVTMRAFCYSGLLRSVVDVPGAWGDQDPYIVSFPIATTIHGVVRIEILHDGEALASKNFSPPTTFEAGTTSGWEK